MSKQRFLKQGCCATGIIIGAMMNGYSILLGRRSTHAQMIIVGTNNNVFKILMPRK